MRGIFPADFIRNPLSYSLNDAYGQMDAFTYEEFDPEELTFSHVLLPPIRHGGKITKGVLASPGIEVLNNLFPSLREYFITISNSRWCSYPWSRSADAWFVSYANTTREEWYSANNPWANSKTKIPLQTTDFTNERQFVPDERVEKDIDLLIVARLDPCKNLGFLARVLKCLKGLNRPTPIRVAWVLGEDYRRAATRPGAAGILAEMELALGRVEDEIDVLGEVDSRLMPNLYRRSKVLFLTSLIEGKNRAVSEAMCSNLPVVVMRDFNRAARGYERLIPSGAGFEAPNDVEAAARLVLQAISNFSDFSPRSAFLERGGKMGALWRCLDSLKSHEAWASGGYGAGSEEQLSALVQDGYGVTLDHFVYYATGNTEWARRWGVKSLHRGDGASEMHKLLRAYAVG